MRGEFVERGGFWVVGQIGLMLAVIVSGVAWPGPARSLPLTACAVVFFLAAAGCGLLGARALGRNLTPFPRPSAETRLVQQGIYGWMRHPLYTAVMSAGIGWGLLWASWPALLAALALALFFDAKARREECWLRQQFPGYAEYERRVRRFVPGIY